MMKSSVVGFGVAGLVACGASADVRIIHASPDAPAVDVYVNEVPGVGSPAITGLAFTQGTGYIGLPTGTYDLAVTATGAFSPVISAPGFAIDETQDITIVAVNFLSSIQPLVLNDDRTSDPFAARVRFVHAAPDVPTVDIGLAGGGPLLFDGVSFGESGGYISVGAGSYDLDVLLGGTGTVALSVPGVELQNGFVYTIFAMGSLATNDVQAVVFVDAIPTPGTLGVLAMAGLAMSRRRR